MGSSGMKRRFETTQATPLAPPRRAIGGQPGAHQIPPHMELTRKQPAGIRQAFMLPALALGAAFVALVGSALLVIGIEIGWPWGFIPGSAGTVALGGLLYLVGGKAARAMLSEALWTTETATGKDFNQDGAIGQPRETFTIEQPEPKATGAVHWEIVHPKGRTEDFAEFAFAAVTGDSIAMDAWCGGSASWSRSEYIHNRQECIRLKWIRWRDGRNHSLGLEVTREGKFGFGRWLEEHASTHAHATGGQLTIPAR